MAGLTYEEINLVAEGVCDACKGAHWMHDSGCYEHCGAFQEEAAEVLDGMGVDDILDTAHAAKERPENGDPKKDD